MIRTTHRTQEEPPHILVADDNRLIAVMLTRYLERLGYRADWEIDAGTALGRILSQEYDVAMVDIVMPRMSGLELLQEAHRHDTEMPIILMTARPNDAYTQEAIRYGAFDFLIKPFDLNELKKITARAVEHRRALRSKQECIQKLVLQFQSQNSQLRQEVDRTVVSLITVMEARIPRSYSHGMRVSQLVQALAHHMGIDEESAAALKLAGLLHDLGMIGLSDSIINKETELSEEEKKTLEQHVEIGYRIIHPITYLTQVTRYVREHHERLDGSGYPRGLREYEIHPFSHLLIVAEVFDSLHNDQPYRKAWALPEIRQYFHDSRGQLFEEGVVDALFALLDRFGEEFSGQWVDLTETHTVPSIA